MRLLLVRSLSLSAPNRCCGLNLQQISHGNVRCSDRLVGNPSTAPRSHSVLGRNCQGRTYSVSSIEYGYLSTLDHCTVLNNTTALMLGNPFGLLDYYSCGGGGGGGGYWSNKTSRGNWKTPMVRRCSSERKRALDEICTREKQEHIRPTPPQDGVYFQDLEADLNHMVQHFTANELAAGCRAYDHILQAQAHRLRSGGARNYCDMSRVFSRYKKCSTNRSFMMPILDEGLSIEQQQQQQQEGDSASSSVGNYLCGIRYPSRDEDIPFMVNKYPAPALARGIRARAEHLQYCAKLFDDPTAKELLEAALRPFEATNIMAKRNKYCKVDFSRPLNGSDRRLICKVLTDDAARLGLPYLFRAAVVLAICHVEGVPSLLFQIRGANLISYPKDVCLPGGKQEFYMDKSIIQTGIREMEEEISGLPHNTEPIAALRCPWEELQALTCGRYAVTPVVAYIGEISEHHLKPATREVKELFTVPLKEILADENWSRDRLHKAPIFGGGPKEIWGLTGYIVDLFAQKLILLDINHQQEVFSDLEPDSTDDELNERPYYPST